MFRKCPLRSSAVLIGGHPRRCPSDVLPLKTINKMASRIFVYRNRCKSKLCEHGDAIRRDTGRKIEHLPSSWQLVVALVGST